MKLTVKNDTVVENVAAVYTGEATLYDGIVVVKTPYLRTSSRITATHKEVDGTIGILTVPRQYRDVAGGSFRIQSESPLGGGVIADDSTLEWILVNP